MALLEDIFKGNVLTGAAVALGAVLLAPAAGQVLRPAAKAFIKGGMLAYRGLAEVGEMASDLIAEAHAELEAERSGDAKTTQFAIEPSPRRSDRAPVT